LDLSRMETGDLHFNIKDYPLLECCQMALESVRYRMPDGVKLTFSPAGEPIVVHVDNLRLQQLLTNLLTNAAKFTEVRLTYRSNLRRIGKRYA
jgi:signal transduction histidine kinase